jgi:hypothetical protein
MKPVGQQSSSVERNAARPSAVDAVRQPPVAAAVVDSSSASALSFSSPSRFMPLYSRLRHARLASPSSSPSANSLFASPARTAAMPSGSAATNAAAAAGLTTASPFAPWLLPEFPPEIDEFEEGATLPDHIEAPESSNAATVVSSASASAAATQLLSLSPRHAPAVADSGGNDAAGIGTHPPPPSPRTPRSHRAAVGDDDSDGSVDESSPSGAQPQFFDSLSPVALKNEFDAASSASLPSVPPTADCQAVLLPLAEPIAHLPPLIPPPDLSKFAPRLRPWSAVLNIFSRIRAHAVSFVLALFATRAVLWAMRHHRLGASGLLGRVMKWVRRFARAFRAWFVRWKSAAF